MSKGNEGVPRWCPMGGWVDHQLSRPMFYCFVYTSQSILLLDNKSYVLIHTANVLYECHVYLYTLYVFCLFVLVPL